LSEIFEVGFEKRKMVEKWREYVSKIAKASKEILGECEVYVFGSVAENKWTGGSDVDVLIISNNTPLTSKERAEIIAEIEEKTNLPPAHPFEIHLVTRKEAEWYWKHVRKVVKIA